jgi:hypothetical protein
MTRKVSPDGNWIASGRDDGKVLRGSFLLNIRESGEDNKLKNKGLVYKQICNAFLNL